MGSSKATEITNDEVDLLGRLLQGHEVRGPLRAAIRLVSHGWAEWTEPEGRLALTDSGRQAALQLWPGVIAADVRTELPGVGGPEISRQISLGIDGPRPNGTSLADALARVLGAHGDVRVLVDHVLEHYPQGRGLASAPKRSLQALGLTPAQASAVADAFELVRACQRERRDERIDSAEQMARRIYEEEGVADLEVESFWVVALDSGRHLVSITRVAQGDLGRVDVVIRDVFVPLVRARAAAAYIAHNHPSGDPRWSDSDVRLTQRVVACGQRLGIEIVDHLIIAPTGAFVSMEQEGIL